MQAATTAGVTTVLVKISFQGKRSRFGAFLQATAGALDTSTVKLREGANTVQVYSVPVGSTTRTLVVQTITVVRGIIVGADGTSSNTVSVTTSSSSSSSDDNAAAIGGGIGGGIAALLLIGGIAFLVVKKSRASSGASSSAPMQRSARTSFDDDYTYDYSETGSSDGSAESSDNSDNYI